MALLIYVSYWPIACSVRCKTAGTGSFEEESKHRPLHEKRVSDDRLISCPTSKLSSQSMITRFRWAVHSSVCYSQDVFSHKAWGVVYDFFNYVLNWRTFVSLTKNRVKKGTSLCEWKEKKVYLQTRWKPIRAPAFIKLSCWKNICCLLSIKYLCSPTACVFLYYV